MIRSRTWWRVAGLGSLTSLTLLSLAASRSENAEKPQRTPNGPAPRVAHALPGVELDVRKGIIESPTKRLIVAKSAAAAKAFVNPKVKAGLVRWHDTFAAACTASAKTKKPVLLFHLMGKLDDQFR
jgi:hypothetical protein